MYPFIVSSKLEIRQYEFQQAARMLAERMRRDDIRPGERIAVIGENSIDYLLTLAALWQMEAVAVLMNTRFPQSQMISELNRVECRNVILLDPFPSLQSKFRDHGFSALTLDTAVEQFDEKIQPDKPRPNILSEIKKTQPATIIFTSGSSGNPKAALHSFGNHHFSAIGSNRNIPFARGDRWLLSLPLYHVGGLAIFFRALTGGGAVFIPEQTGSLAAIISENNITHISLVATQFFRLLQETAGKSVLSRLKAILLGGSAIPASLIQQAVDRNLPIHTSYGSTEMSSHITATPQGAGPEILQTSGKLLPFREIKIAAEREILVRGETLFQGYIEENSFVETVDADGWFHTGDTGIIDDSGYLTVTGRKDNMFISGGENIQPEEIEKHLYLIEDIEQAIVVKIENAEFGWRPAAFIKMKYSDTIDKTTIADFLKQYIAKFKIPDYFFPWPDAVPSPGIKENRRYLQKLAAKILLDP